MQNEQENRWVNFYKPVGMRSTKAVEQIKKLYNAKKAGHAGTLDPLADGVLPIALNGATKQMADIVAASKEYFFTIEFGKQTETDDAEGAIVAQSPLLPTRAHIQDCIKEHFLGTIQQTPPVYSAIRVNGVRSYNKARAGIAEPLAARSVMIHSLTIPAPEEIEQLNEIRFLLAQDTQTSPLFPNNHTDQNMIPMITLKAHVSKGTYIRSLARDMGLLLGCYGYVKVLTRTKVGNFDFYSKN